MEKIDIRIKKTSKGSEYLEGPFYVKEMDADECLDFHDKTGKDGTENNHRLIQMCLVNKSCERIFKAQQMKTIVKRLSGIDYLCVIEEINGLHDWSKIGKIAEKYKKNSSSDPSSQ